MRMLTFLLAMIYLQGCLSTRVVRLATGKETAELPESNIVGSWYDGQNKEFVMCLEVTTDSNSPDKFLSSYSQSHTGLITLKIPQEIGKHENALVDIKSKTIYEQPDDPHWWRSDSKRNDVRAFGVTLTVERGCNATKGNWQSVAVYPSPGIQTTYFKGKLLDEMLKKQQPFVIKVPSEGFTVNWSYSPCSQLPCIELVSNPIGNSDAGVSNDKSQQRYSEILTVNELIWQKDPEPLWYFAMPFALGADAVVIGIILFVIGSAGYH